MLGLVSFEGFEFVTHVEIRPIRWIGSTEGGGLRFCEAISNSLYERLELEKNTSRNLGASTYRARYMSKSRLIDI